MLYTVFFLIAPLPHTELIAAMFTRERQRGIGLLMSMGAKRNVISFVVMAESLVLTASGGIAGVAAGIGIFSLLNMQGIINGPFRLSSLCQTRPRQV